MEENTSAPLRCARRLLESAARDALDNGRKHQRLAALCATFAEERTGRGGIRTRDQKYARGRSVVPVLLRSGYSLAEGIVTQSEFAAQRRAAPVFRFARVGGERR